MRTDEVEPPEVREWLGQALEGVPVPQGGGTEAVFARAARVRARRRAVLAGVVTAVAAGSVVVGPGLLPGGGRGTKDGKPQVTQAPGARTAKAAAFAKLLPAGVGEIREVSMDYVLWRETHFPMSGPVGSYYGSYAVSRDGGVGFVRVLNFTSPKAVAGWSHPCDMPTKEDVGTCSFERLPNGNVLEFRKNWTHLAVMQDKRQKWGEYLMVTLYLKKGGTLQVDDTAGFTGRNSLGPLLTTPPLTKSQLRELALNPQLLMKSQR
ncbi:hypothetical protein [Streptomyces sp. NBC_00986]|uniref:hypothetical protein n=1 Tax=Streptomyces sp. NBC_00986 TaxID=2903702 RepID=UPI00386687A8|nr:hypothetical protein OG504_18740 [Streptomyces sp. NBC_00986]